MLPIYLEGSIVPVGGQFIHHLLRYEPMSAQSQK
jgi:hypothetical protein